MQTRKKILLLLAMVAISFVGTFFIKNWLYPPNLLLKKLLKTVFTIEDRLKEDWRGGGFHATLGKQKLAFYFQEKFADSRNHYFILTYIKNLPEELSDKHKKLFKHESRIIGDKKIDLYSYSTGKLKQPAQKLKTYDEILEMVLSDRASKPTELLALPRVFPKTGENKQSPEKISAQQCANLLKNKRFLFYTGAGLSIAAGIPTGRQVKNEAGHDKTKEIDQFAMRVLTNPQAIIDVHKKFEETFRHAKPTAAHRAIADLAMKCNIHVITSNRDLLHEQTGVKAWDIMHPDMYDSWFGKKPIPESGNFAYLQANPQWLKNIDFVVCIGMSADVKGFLAWYKKNNPKGKIIAINKSNVPYLSTEDYLVQGDIQKIVPKIVKLLLNEPC